MRLPWIAFILLLGMCCVLCVTFLIEEIPREDVIGVEGNEAGAALGHGFEHSRFPSMQQGGDGLQRHSRVFWFGWAFGILQILFYVACLAFGASRKGRIGPIRKALIVGVFLYSLIFTFMMISYRTYATTQSHTLFLGHPLPSAWMLFGLWPFPIYFLALYVLKFDRWILTGADLKRFREIIGSNENRVEGER